MNMKDTQIITLDKTIMLGDIHGRTIWMLIIEMEKPTRVIFIGDYFDSYDVSGAKQRMNFKNIMDYKEQHPEIEFVFLIGNHDHHYFPEVGNTGTSGYQEAPNPLLNGELLDKYRDNLQMAYLLDNVLCTHAGVTPTWLEHVGWAGEKIDEFINDLWKHKPMAFKFESYGGRSDSSGNNIWQSPIWVRPRSLMQDGQEFKKTFIQIVGHTQQETIDMGKSTGGRYFFIDALGMSQEYLIYENKQFKKGKI